MAKYLKHYKGNYLNVDKPIVKYKYKIKHYEKDYLNLLRTIIWFLQAIDLA